MLLHTNFSPELELAQGIMNAIMEDLLAPKRGHFVADITHELCDQIYYQRNDDFNGHGRVKFWHVLDNIIQKFNKYEMSLRPISTKEKEERKMKQLEEERLHKKNQAGRARNRGKPHSAKGKFFKSFHY